MGIFIPAILWILTSALTPEGEDIIIDAGGKGKGDEIVSYLQSHKVDDIEIMVSTHPDVDHIGGLDEVLG
jgi:competence protein ComEC